MAGNMGRWIDMYTEYWRDTEYQSLITDDSQ